MIEMPSARSRRHGEPEVVFAVWHSRAGGAILTPRELHDLPGEDFGLFMMQHVTCTGHGDNLEIANVSAHLLGSSPHVEGSVIAGVPPRQQHGCPDASPTGLRLLAPVEHGVHQPVTR